MKKFISMVMAAAMVVSLVPATAFAADAKATVKVVDSKDLTEGEAELAEKGYKSPKPAETPTKGIQDAGARPEVQIKITSADFTAAELAAKDGVKTEVTLTLENAEWIKGDKMEVADFTPLITVTDDNVGGTGNVVPPTLTSIKDVDDDQVTLVFSEKDKAFEKDDKIAIKLDTVVLTKTSAGTKATVAVDSDDLGVTTEDLTFVTVQDDGIKATIKKVAEVAEEETTPLEKDLKIETAAGKFVYGQEFEIKVSSGFELKPAKTITGTDYKIEEGEDDNKLLVTIKTDNNVAGTKYADTLTINAKDIIIDAADAKVGAVAKLTVKTLKNDKVPGSFKATADAVEAAKVVADELKVTVDEDEDVPVIYSGVNVDNKGITDDSDHKALEVTIEEPVKDTLDVKKELTLELPEGVYATAVKVGQNDFKADFEKAYDKGDFETFKFARRTLESTVNSTKEGKLEFTLTLVAEPGFTGDVTLKVNGGGLDKAKEVVIAKFVSPYTVEASQNDMIIDYRNTKVPTNVVVKEAEAGLWKKDSEFVFGIDKFDKEDLEDDATYTVDDKSEMEVKKIKNVLGFKVDSESSDAAAAVTISDISLYMGRNLAAGAYDLTLDTTGSDAFMAQTVLGATDDTKTDNENEAEVRSNYYDNDKQFGQTVKEGFVNIITAGRDQDDASFTKKVVVPVGEKYLIAGEEQVALDVPAYISAAGYTMLPVRAVATALGINNNNVLWNQASRTVTILYGQRIITMVAGQKVVTVNGNTIPASATVQIKDGRTFLPMRDLATALGVTDITWDAATKTATMNGNQNK